MWDLIESVPDHCLPFYFAVFSAVIFTLNEHEYFPWGIFSPWGISPMGKISCILGF